MDIRPATVADVDGLTDCERETSEESLAHLFGGPYPTEEVRGRWAALVGDPDATVLVAVEDGAVVGYAGWAGQVLRHLGVRPSAYGSGLAVDLLGRAVTAMGGTATLWVLEGNTRARRFYERQGWVADGRVQPCEFAPYPLEVGYRVG